MMDFGTFEKQIGVTFIDKKLLEQAFIHRSYINENSGSHLSHNERLEFLGDAVLELVVTDHLYRKYPDRDEGSLTAYRSALVNANTIGEVAQTLGMNEYLLLSKGEMKDSGRARSYILANTYESFVGALYLDQGYDRACDFIKKTLLGKIDSIVANKSWRDPKSLVQEKSQEYLGVTPEYKVLSESGPDHDKHFTVGIFFGKDRVAQGTGHSKQEAEQAAAGAALEAKEWLE
jgi:ribonuclease III